MGSGTSSLLTSTGAEPDETVVFKTKWFQIRTIPDPKLPSSDPYFVLDRPDSATVIPFTPMGSLLLQRQHRPHSSSTSWEFPMDNIDLGEIPDEQLVEPRSLVLDEGISAHQIIEVSAFRSPVASAEIIDGFTLAAFALWQSVSFPQTQQLAG
ncbi:hypothetical protein G7Y89_g12208 [Cudoniella acicularis]|uniref:Uncharacterized protein n=1 Tax=Cudoniella acicularis TaxID=354080 RepID=A0A8H4R9B2_9HELO|nr:hypothetical protein G7Y89_g12208 [Cudoniella acicularis]